MVGSEVKSLGLGSIWRGTRSYLGSLSILVRRIIFSDLSMGDLRFGANLGLNFFGSKILL